MPTPREATNLKTKTAKKDGNGEDAIKLLTADHRTVEVLFKKFEDAKDDESKADIVDQICEALRFTRRSRKRFSIPRRAML